jgi:hypothetical protein
MRPMLCCFLLLMPLGVSACQSLESMATHYDPATQATWERQSETDKPFYAYKTEGGRSSVQVGAGGVAISPVQNRAVVLVSIGTTQVTRRDGTNQSVTIYTGVSGGQANPR